MPSAAVGIKAEEMDRALTKPDLVANLTFGGAIVGRCTAVRVSGPPVRNPDGTGDWLLHNPIDLQVQGPGDYVGFDPQGRDNDAPLVPPTHWIDPKRGLELAPSYHFFWRNEATRQRALWRQFGDCGHIAGTHFG